MLTLLSIWAPSVSASVIKHQAWGPLGIAVDGGKRRLVDDRGCPSGTGDLVEDILRDFRICESGKVVMHGDPLAQDLIDCQDEGLLLVPVKVEDLLLYGAEHAGVEGKPIVRTEHHASPTILE